jgi:uncharacterized protein (DUF58 family)
MNLLPVLLAVLVLAFVTGSHSLFYLAYALVGLMLLSWLWVLRAHNALSGVRRFSHHAFYGEELEVQLEVANQGRWPIPWLELHESLPVALHGPNFERRVLSLAAGEQTTVRYTLHCHRRGYYQLGPLALSTGDLIGLGPDRSSTVSEDVLIVYPKIVPLPSLQLPSQIPFGSLRTQTSFFEDPCRFFGVRAYQPGDSLRNVNWRTSARLSHLQVKRFQPAVALQSVIFLDLNADAYSIRSRNLAEELGCTVAASIAVRLLEQRQQVALNLLGRDEVSGYCGLQRLPLGRGREHLTHLLEMLARARMAPATTLASWLPQAGANLGWGSTAVVITAGEAPKLVEALLQMRRRGFQVLFIALDPRKPFHKLKARLHHIGVPAFWIARERELDVWR